MHRGHIHSPELWQRMLEDSDRKIRSRYESVEDIAAISEGRKVKYPRIHQTHPIEFKASTLSEAEKMSGTIKFEPCKGQPIKSKRESGTITMRRRAINF